MKHEFIIYRMYFLFLADNIMIMLIFFVSYNYYDIKKVARTKDNLSIVFVSLFKHLLI